MLKLTEINSQFFLNVQSLKLQMAFRQKWIDPRLKFNESSDGSGYLSLTDVNKLWLPDTFFSNSIDEHRKSLLKENILIRIKPNGKILYSTRIILEVLCPMDFKLFPFDKQQCKLRIASCKYFPFI